LESSQTEAAIFAAALASLMEHPNEAVRNATHEAIQAATACASPSWQGDRPDSNAGSDNVVRSVEEWLKEVRDTSAPATEASDAAEDETASKGTSDGAWEKLTPVPVEIFRAEVSAKILGATLSLEPRTFEDPAARGDITAQCAPVITQYERVNQAFCLGCVAVEHGHAGAAAVATATVMNDGTLAWPASSALRLIAGPALGLPEVPLGALAPGEAAQIVMDFAVERGQPGESGRSAWTMVDEQGEPFGPLFIFESHRV